MSIDDVTSEPAPGLLETSTSTSTRPRTSAAKSRASLTRLRLSLPLAIKGFAIGTSGDDASTIDQMFCREVRGFREAMTAAADPQAPMPARIVLVVPDVDMAEWLRCWSEDAEHIRRTLTIRRLFDGRKVTAVATLASYGSGIDTSLGIESITTTFRPCALVRSGVHPVAALDEALELRAQRDLRD